MAEQLGMQFLALVDPDAIREEMRRDEARRQGAELPVLNDQQQRFVAEYLVDLNGTQAAIRAGYASKSAYAMANKLLRNAEIARQIGQQQARHLRRRQLTAEAVLEEIRKIAFADMRGLFNAAGDIKPVEEWPEELSACIASFEVEEVTQGSGDKRRVIGKSKKVKLYSKLDALKLLAAHFRLLIDAAGSKIIDGTLDAEDGDLAGLTEEQLREQALDMLRNARGRINAA